MKTALSAGTLLLLGVVVALAGAAQDKTPPTPGRTAVLHLRDCMDKTRNVWIADIEQELQKQQDSDSGRASDLNPQERQRIRTKHLDTGNRRRMEVYAEIVRLCGVIARERGFEIVQRVDRMPSPEPGEVDLMGQFDRRTVIYFDAAADITPAVLERLNQEYAARKK